MIDYEVTLSGDSKRLRIERCEGGYKVDIDDRELFVSWTDLEPGHHSILLGGRQRELHVVQERDRVYVHCGAAAKEARVQDLRQRRRGGAAAGDGRFEISAAMPGKVVRVLVEEGQTVETGQGIVVLEAMKMENELGAGQAGMVKEILVKAGDLVENGALLVRLGPLEKA